MLFFSLLSLLLPRFSLYILICLLYFDCCCYLYILWLHICRRERTMFMSFLLNVVFLLCQDIKRNFNKNISMSISINLEQIGDWLNVAPSFYLFFVCVKNFASKKSNLTTTKPTTKTDFKEQSDGFALLHFLTLARVFTFIFVLFIHNNKKSNQWQPTDGKEQNNGKDDRSPRISR